MEYNNRPLLSFAVPTYNFGKFIAETIQSIEDGIEVISSSEFEIIILDGGSKDETDVVVETLSKRYGNIRYVKQLERGGIDRDMDTVAGFAKGQYIWLFSADDLLESGWDKLIIPLLKSNQSDLLLVPAILCDLKMKPLRENPIFRGCIGVDPEVFYLNQSDNSLTEYLNRAATLEALFSFMSSLIVKTDVWHSLPCRVDYFGSCWAHCARLMPLLHQKTTITYLNRFLIRKRGENDSFMENGFVARIAIAVDGWSKIIGEFFSDTALQSPLFQRLRRDMPILLFIYAKISAKNSDEICRLNKMAKLLFIEKVPTLKTKLNYYIYRLIPASALLNSIIKPYLPMLIRIRHKIKSFFL